MRTTVIGLDGSLQNFGIAVATVDWDKWEIVSVDNLLLSKTAKDAKMKRADDDFARFYEHISNVRWQINKHQVDEVYGEIPSGSRDVRAAFAFGGVTAILAFLAQDFSVTTVTPADVKVAATGTKHADKEDVIEAMYRLYPTAPWITGKKANAMNIQTVDGLYLTNANEHLADAIAVIHAGIIKQKKVYNK